MVYPFPRRQILDSPKLKEFADDNFRFDKNGINFSKLVENTEGKGEIARYEQFLLFPQCFQKTWTVENQGLFGKGLRSGLCAVFTNKLLSGKMEYYSTKRQDF